MAISTILEAIKAKWDGSALPGVVTGGLYLSQIPEMLGSTRIDLPYAYVELSPSRYEWTMSEIYYEIADVDFCVYVAGSGVTLESIATTLQSTFDWTTLGFSDGVTTHTYLRPIDKSFSAEPVKYRDGSIVYSARFRYEIFVSRLRSTYP